jgi:hypothetical protein
MNPIPDLVEPIVGWRTWNAQSHQGNIFLGSLVWSELWHPGRRMGAECIGEARTTRGRCCGKYFTSELPVNCTCGIYAYRTYKELIEQRPCDQEFYRKPLWKSRVIHGEVNLWGRVIQGKLAYRAQYAYPKQLLIHAYLPEDVERCEKLANYLGDLYKVPSRLVVAY